jgi:hypothetical protein
MSIPLVRRIQPSSRRCPWTVVLCCGLACGCDSPCPEHAHSPHSTGRSEDARGSTQKREQICIERGQDWALARATVNSARRKSCRAPVVFNDHARSAAPLDRSCAPVDGHGPAQPCGCVRIWVWALVHGPIQILKFLWPIHV